MVGTIFSRVKQGSMPQLSDVIANSLANQQKVLLIFDFDGTLFPFCDDPNKVEMDEKCRQALTALSKTPNVRIVGLTGRDLAAAQTMVNGIEMEIVGSHGAEFLTKDGHIETYPFTEDQLAHIQNAQNQVHLLHEEFPDLHIEVDKFGSVGVNLSRYVGQTDVREAVFAALEKYQNDSFSIAYEGKKGNDLGWEIEVRPAEHVCGKHIGITHFIRPDRNDLTIFHGDSFGDHGTDTPAAILLNNKQEFSKGVVVMVMNGRNSVPPQGSPQSPDYVMQSPAALGEQLMTGISMAGLKRTPHALHLESPHL